MKITCIAGSNVLAKKHDSTSVKMCEKARELIQEMSPEVEVHVLPLLEYQLSPCIMCGTCADTQICAHDEAYNHILSRMIDSDGVVLVSPLYASIPAKLTMLLEKLQQLIYGGHLRSIEKGTEDEFVWVKKPVAIIGHGGTPESLEDFDPQKYYTEKLVKPLAKIMPTIQMEVIPLDDERPYGLPMGIKRMKKVEGELFHDMEHDWESVTQRMRPLIVNLVNYLQQNLD